MKQRVKSAVGLVLAALLLCGSAQAAPAGTYSVEELRMEITVPEGYYVFDVDTVEDDPDLLTWGLDGAQMAQTMKAGNIYLEIVPEDLSWELCLTMTESEEFQPIFDFNLFDDHYFDRMMNELPEEYGKMGLNIQNWSLWQGKQAKFVIIDTSQGADGGEVLRKQFYTIYNGQAINLTMISYIGAITDEMEELQKTVAESIHFTETLTPPQEALDAAKAFGEKEPSILMSALRGAVIGGVAGGVGYAVFHWLGKKRKKKTDVSGVEIEEKTGGDNV